MNPSRMASRVVALFLGLLLCFGIAGKHTEALAEGQPETFPCVADDNLEKMVAPEAELVAFSCFTKRWEGSDTLHFKVIIKNVTDKLQRYRVHIFLDNGKAVGGLIPEKVKKGLVKPGETASFVYPVSGMPGKPQSVMLRITAMGE